MNVIEACEILGVKTGCSEKEFNDAFRKLSVTKHPDKNKSENAEEEYKKITEAHQFLKKNGTEPNHYSDNQFIGAGGGGFSFNLNDFFNMNYGAYQNDALSHIRHNTNISFEESILGVSKTVEYKRNKTCTKCDGESAFGKTCKNCQGRGAFGEQRGYVTIMRNCPVCKGTGKTKEEAKTCKECNNSGLEEEKNSITVKIPPGIISGNKLRLSRQGHYNNHSGDFGDLYVTINVEPSAKFIRNGNNVVSTIEISLLEALKGCSKVVDTVKGTKDLKIKAGIKNGDILSVKGYGVPPNGCHDYIVGVTYPEDTSSIIEVLEKQK